MKASKFIVLSLLAILTSTAVTRGQTCSAAPPGLVGWWSGEGNSLDNVSLGYGSLEGNLAFATGEVGSAFYFDGADDYVRIPASTHLNLGQGDGLTLEAWINPSDLVGAHPILEWNNDNASLPGLIFWLGHINTTTGYLHADLFDGVSDHIIESDAGTIVADTMQHVALTYDKTTGIARLFVNSIVVKQQSLGTVTARNTGNLYIGARPGAAQPIFFQGIIDEPSVYSRALTADEIAVIYAAGSLGKCPPPPVLPTLIVQPTSQFVVLGNTATFSVTASNALFYQWFFNDDALSEQTNSTLTIPSVQLSDIGNYYVVASNLNGSVTSTNAALVSVVPSCIASPTDLVGWWPGDENTLDAMTGVEATLGGGAGFGPGEVGQAFNFDGMDDYVRVPASTTLNLGTQTGFTLEAWINPSSVEGAHPILEWNNDTATLPGLIFWLGHINATSGYLHVDMFNGSDHIIESTPGTIAANTMQHVAVTYDKTSGLARIFLNGVVIKEQSLGSVSVRNTGNLYIGARLGPQPQFFQGIIDEPSVYNRALTTNEILSIYQAESFGKCPVPPSPPSITEHPTNRTVIAGLPTTFAVTAFGWAPLSYQWRWNGTNIDNATNSTFDIANAQFNQAGLYSVLVTNIAGAAESSNALLALVPQPLVPVIYSFIPGKAKVGEAVQLIGTNFSSIPASNIVYFGAVQALVVTASPTNLTVVTPSGSTFAPLSVMVDGRSSQASTPFLPTYVGASIITNSSFGSKVDFAASSSQSTIAIGDLDGDGKPDLVVGNNTASSVSVYRNISSNGTINASSFATRITFSTGSSPCVSLADVDVDGKLDILVANAGNTVPVLRNTSAPGVLTNTSFANRVNFTAGSGPLKVVVADFDRDGKPDLAVANSTSGSVSLFHNLSTPGIINTASFAAPVDIITGANVRDVEAADLDGDGKMDLAVANFGNNNVSVLRNVGTYGILTANSFAPRVDLPTGSAYNIAIGDLDGDGRPDLIVDNRPASIAVFRNLSTPGTLTTNSFAAKVSLPTGGEPYMVAIGDVDGDGKPDLTASIMNSNTISVLHSKASAGIITSNSYDAYINFATANGPRTAVLADVDSDGQPDLIAASSLSSVVSVLKNTIPLPPLPSFVTQPVSQLVILGDPVLLTVGASNALHFQWRFNGGDLVGQTNSSILLPEAQPSSAGNYSVLASNLFGSATSTNAVVTVVVPNCVSAAGLVGWWTGNGDGLDAVGTNNGVIQGGVGFAAGKAGQAFQLGVTNDGVRIPASAAINVGTGNGFTLECWVKLNTIIGNNPLLEWNDGSESTGSLWGVHLHVGSFGPGTLYANIVGPGGAWHQIYSAQDIVKSNVFAHVGLTYDKTSGVARLFCNGTMVNEQSIGTFTPLTDTDLYIGKRPSGGFVANSVGLIDEVSLYNRALDTNEIAAIYGARGTGKCSVPRTTSVNIVNSVIGKTLTLTWPSDHIGWKLQTQTNALNSGLNSKTNAWFDVPGTTNTNSISATIDPTKPAVFYRLVYP